VIVEGLAQRHAAVELVGDEPDRGGQPPAFHVGGDEAQTLLDRQAGLVSWASCWLKA